MKSNFMLAWAAGAMLLLGSCAQNTMPVTSTQAATEQSNDPNLLNGSWKLVSLNGKPVTVQDTSRAPQLAFQEDQQRVNGYTGCNRVFGGATATATHLSFQHMGSTRMACADDAWEQPFLATLAETTLAYQVTALQLTLFKENQPVAVFSRIQAE